MDRRGKRIDRRQALGVLGAAGAGLALGCGDTSEATPTATSPPPSTSSSCAVTPTETAGPFPSLSQLVRSDIREGRPGTTLALTIRVVDVNAGCAPIPNASVGIWQVDAAGNYSGYGSQAGQTFLRGIQTTGASGEVVFTTVYPGWYPGRATHIHAEVTVGGVSRKITQIAFPESVSSAVHTSGVYASRGVNPTSNAQDGIFADSLAAELVTPTGSPSAGYAAAFRIGIAV